MSVSRIELDRPGPSYTVDTLRELRESYAQDELFLLMGTDMFLSFFQWREPEAIAKLATPVCMARVRADAALSAQPLQQQSQDTLRPPSASGPSFCRTTVWRSPPPRPGGCSSSASRTGSCTRTCWRRSNGKGSTAWAATTAALPFEDLRRVSLSLHKEKRRAHAQGVSDTAVQLAQKYGADETDCCPCRDPARCYQGALSWRSSKQLVDHWELPVTPFEHAQTAAAPRQDWRGGCRTHFRRERCRRHRHRRITRPAGPT